MNEHEATIRAARDHSNRSIARRNLLGTGDSLAEDFVGVIGDGTFVASRAEYLKLFKQNFDSKQYLRYERIADTIIIDDDELLASEQGHWFAATTTGKVAYTGHYSAMWRRTDDGWKIRTELFVSLTANG